MPRMTQTAYEQNLRMENERGYHRGHAAGVEHQKRNSEVQLEIEMNKVRALNALTEAMKQQTAMAECITRALLNNSNNL